MLATGTVFSGDFRVESPLSSGGMGEVYVATQISTGRKRALKLMHADLVKDPRLLERFALEAQVGARIDSEHVVEVIAAGVDPSSSSPYLVMELLEGETLTEYMDRKGVLPPGEVSELFRQLCHAIGAAHMAAIIHRDLKPDNVFLSKSRRADVRFTVKVLDFGIAKLLAEAQTSRTGAMGTPMWMAPEQTEPGATVTPAADVWALGLMAFRALTGRAYWRGAKEGGSVQQVMREVVIEPMQSASERSAALGGAPLPRGFDDWFRKATERDPSQRFPNAHRAFDELELVLDGRSSRPNVGATFTGAPMSAAFGSVPPPPTPPPVPAQRASFAEPLAAVAVAPKSAPQWPFAVGLAVVLLGAGVAGYLVMKPDEKPARARLADDDDDDEPRRAPASASASAAVVGPWEQTGEVAVTSSDPAQGAKDAPVTIVVFSNLGDPDAKKLYPKLQALRSKYGDKLRLVWKDGWVTKDAARALPSAIAARTVFLEKGADAFFKLVSHGYVESEPDAAPLEAWAVKELGVDSKAFETRRADATQQVELCTSQAGKLRIDGIPGVYVNGIKLPYTVDAPELVTTIDAELAAVNTETKQGLAASGVYEARVAKNFKVPESKPVAAAKEETPFAAKVSAGTSPSRGPSDAPIVVIEFSEFQCPYCRKVAPTLKRLQESYAVDTRLVFKHRLFPSHDRCIPAGNIAFEAKKKGGDAAFWQAVDLLTAPEADKLDDDALSAVATKLGLPAAAMTCANSNCNKAELELVNAEADAAGVRGIPAMFINGRAINGNQPYEAFESLVLWERAKIQKHVEGGGTRADYKAASATRLRALASVTMKDTQLGLGAYAVPGKTLSIHYRGTLPDGKEFDSSLAGNVPLRTLFKPGQFVIGFEEGIIGMREGGKRTITLPPEAHYGPNGRPPKIPANTVLTFDLELVKVE